ncbi:MAG: SUMF1/EgtB/PvdO family nonheme iron enzyme [Vicingaceae bacterium]|nr:SUMF1/EgtB/PvdO family nonheme iron enzyme [Vicingaceae bacterium]
MRLLKGFLFIFLVTAIVVVLTSFIKKDEVKDFSKETPPGTTKIAENLFMDKVEISNFSYLEYQFWLKIVFGKDSDEFLSAQLDTLVWEKDSCLSFYSEYYHNHPAYWDYPVIGISQEQALAFCNWRADRVFEIYLIREKILEHQPNQDAENYFSIENYYNGKYNNTPPDMRYNIYPEYRLPTKEEWLLGKEFFEAYNLKNGKTCKKKYCDYHIKKEDIPNHSNYNVIPCDGDSLLVEPLKPTRCYTNSSLGFYFYGNVSEWLAQEKNVIGGNWRDTTNTHFDIPQHQEYPSEYVGFRCVATWKKYEKK